MPTFKNNDIKFYYLIVASSNFWLISGTWIFFWLKQMDILQLGIFNSITFGISLLCEIPSGVIADVFGNRITLIISRILAFAGIITMAFSTNMWTLFIGDTIFWIGNAFYSGAAESYLFNTMERHSLKDKYEFVLTKAASLSLAFTIIGSILGSFLYLLNERLPWIIFAISLLFSIYFTYKLTKLGDYQTKLSNHSLKSLWETFRIGSQELLNPKLKKYFWSFIAISSIIFFFEEGFIKPYYTNRFGFDAFNSGLVFGIINIINLFIINIFGSKEFKFSSFSKLFVLEIILFIAFAIANFNIGLVIGFFILLVISLISVISKPLITNIISLNSDEKYKATTISSLAMLSKLPYSILALAAAIVISQDLVWIVNGCICMILVLAIINLIYNRK